MFVTQEELDLINDSEFISNKLEILAIYFKLWSYIKGKMGSVLGEEYCANMMGAYLKVYISTLKEPVSVSDFVHGLVRIMRVGKLLNDEKVSNTMSKYESNIDLLKDDMSYYIEKISTLNKPLLVKERMVMRVQKNLDEIFDNMRVKLNGWDKLIVLKRKVISAVSEDLESMIDECENTYEFGLKIKEKAFDTLCNISRSETLDFAFVMLQETGIFNQPLGYFDFKDYELLKLLSAHLLVFNSSDVEIDILQKRSGLGVIER